MSKYRGRKRNYTNFKKNDKIVFLNKIYIDIRVFFWGVTFCFFIKFPILLVVRTNVDRTLASFDQGIIVYSSYSFVEK